MQRLSALTGDWPRPRRPSPQEKDVLAAAKAAKQKRLTELTDAKLMLDWKVPKAAQAASRRRPSSTETAWSKQKCGPFVA
mmetsp:Transcript_24548/g.78900  ORF Transcript_24548/g.78900 Transcript_24548/m.78900 type:complete len:80 (+) Transcript_24548:1519-1758(+)